MQTQEVKILDLYYKKIALRIIKKQHIACNYLRGYNETQEVKILDLYYKNIALLII